MVLIIGFTKQLYFLSYNLELTFNFHVTYVFLFFLFLSCSSSKHLKLSLQFRSFESTIELITNNGASNNVTAVNPWTSRSLIMIFFTNCNVIWRYFCLTLNAHTRKFVSIGKNKETLNI